MTTRRAGFTLLEVVIALAILAVSLFVLVDSQATAVLMTMDANKTLTGTYLAQEKMAEALLRVEYEGFREGDIDEEGDFSEIGEDDALGSDADLGEDFEDYKWAYTIREVDLQLGDITSAADELQSAGFGAQTEEGQQQTEQQDLTDLGFQPDMMSEMLKPYIREVRVLVWWGNDEPDLEEGCDACIELVTHVINPSGQIVPGSSSESTEESSG